MTFENILCRVYAVSLYAYPRPFRAQFGREMQQVFRDRCRAIAKENNSVQLFQFLFRSLKDWMVSSTAERAAAWKESGARGRLRILVHNPVVLTLLAILLCWFTSATIVRAYVIPTPSMAQSLRVGDHVLVDRIHSRAGDIHRGDIIAFRYPEDSSQTFVKRVIGLPGDHIRLRDKQVIRNGRRLVEPYAEHISAGANAYRDNFPSEASPLTTTKGVDMLQHNVANGEVVVPDDSFFVLGDNRDISSDSRYWGFVRSEDVVGKPWMVYWSYDTPTSELTQWSFSHAVDIAEHLFTKTRWDRTPLLLRSQQAKEVTP